MHSFLCKVVYLEFIFMMAGRNYFRSFVEQIFTLFLKDFIYFILKSFNHKKYSNETELSKYVWHLKENNTDYTIKWSIIKNSISYTGGSKRCNLCLEEKLSILKEKSKYLLNKRSEIVSACHHKNKFQVNHLTKKGMHGI